ncbi:hypothetical protein ISS06_00710 [Patescibacteria group bacterium]|nr:hypothetical protein [Patescibacteria group bacterium]
MAIESKRKQNEPMNFFLKKFSDRVKRSGILNQKKKTKFLTKPLNKRARKENALKKKKTSEQLFYLKKTGRIK